MKEHFIDLTNGERLEINVNFGTIYYLQKCKGFYRIMKKVQEKKKLQYQESMDVSADIVYAVLRSNGKTVTFDEALSLVPPDLEQLKDMLTGFQKEYEKYSKKKTESGDAEVMDIDWAEYVMAARKMGMSEEEFYNSDPIFFNRCYELFQRQKENEVIQFG